MCSAVWCMQDMLLLCNLYSAVKCMQCSRARHIVLIPLCMFLTAVCAHAHLRRGF